MCSFVSEAGTNQGWTVGWVQRSRTHLAVENSGGLKGTILMQNVHAFSASPDEVLLTADQVAERLQVAPSWVYRHAEQLGVLRCGKYRRFIWRVVLNSLKARNDHSPASGR